MTTKHIIARGILAASVALFLVSEIGCKNKPAESTNAKPKPLSPEKTLAEKPPEPKTSAEELPPRTVLGSLSEQQQKEIREITSKAASKDREERQTASEFLDRLGPDETSYLKTLMKDASAEVRRGAALYLLGQASSGEKDLISAYIEMLADEDRKARHIALQAIRRAPKSEIIRAAPGIAALLTNPQENNDNRAAAARLFSSLGPDGDQGLPALLEVLQSDAAEKVRSAALNAIEKIARNEELIAVLKQVLESDSSASLRRISAAKLGRVGKELASQAAPPLSNALEDEQEAVRRGSADALIRLGEEAVSATAKKLEAKNSQTRLLALFVLGKIGKKAKPAEEAIRLLLEDENEQVRKLAKSVLRVLELEM